MFLSRPCDSKNCILVKSPVLLKRHSRPYVCRGQSPTQVANVSTTIGCGSSAWVEAGRRGHHLPYQSPPCTFSINIILHIWSGRRGQQENSNGNQPQKLNYTSKTVANARRLKVNAVLFVHLSISISFTIFTSLARSSNLQGRQTYFLR